jgi:MinD superfamily P-loop ATPase
MNSTRTIIIDAPPGTSCPVVESVKGSDFSLLVTEPTPFGLNDLRLAFETLNKLDIPCGVVINRSDIGDNQVEEYCSEQSIPILMTIPMDRKFAVAYSKGETIIKIQPDYREKFLALFRKILAIKK